LASDEEELPPSEDESLPAFFEPLDPSPLLLLEELFEEADEEP
jgi:hypothetical protein